MEGGNVVSLTEEDLIKPCDECGGRGEITDPPRPPNQGSYGQRVVSQQWTSTCNACRGSGKVFTEAGKAVASVISLMKQQGRL